MLCLWGRKLQKGRFDQRELNGAAFFYPNQEKIEMRKVSIDSGVEGDEITVEP
jgi:hypothetical protein